MQVAHQALQPLVEDVRVDLRRRDIGMPQQFLHHAQIRAVLQEMAGEGVSQYMRADLGRRQPRLRGEGLEIAPEGLPGQMPALAIRRKEPAPAGIAMALC